MAKKIDSTWIADEMTTDTELAGEASVRSSEDLTFLKLDGSRAMNGNLNIGSNAIINLKSPENKNDAANKEFVELTAYYYGIVL